MKGLKTNIETNYTKVGSNTKIIVRIFLDLFKNIFKHFNRLN